MLTCQTHASARKCVLSASHYAEWAGSPLLPLLLPVQLPLLLKQMELPGWFRRCSGCSCRGPPCFFPPCQHPFPVRHPLVQIDVSVMTQTVVVRHDAALTSPAALVAALNSAMLEASLTIPRTQAKVGVC